MKKKELAPLVDDGSAGPAGMQRDDAAGSTSGQGGGVSPDGPYIVRCGRVRRSVVVVAVVGHGGGRSFTSRTPG